MVSAMTAMRLIQPAIVSERATHTRAKRVCSPRVSCEPQSAGDEQKDSPINADKTANTCGAGAQARKIVQKKSDASPVCNGSESWNARRSSRAKAKFVPARTAVRNP